jgi:glycosyltransferase involved in cell wall biosynthesis
LRISVIVPLFNKANYVARAIRSILAQTLTEFELLVVNDGSTDGGEQVVATFTDPRIRLLHQPNAGPGAARNRGLAEARGEYVAFLDADDEWLPEYLASGIRILDNVPEAASVTCGHTEGPSYRELTAFWCKRGIREGLYRVTPDVPTKLLVYTIAYMHPCTTLSRTDILRKLGGFYAQDRCRYAEDAFLFAQVILNHPVYFTFQPLVKIDRSAAQLSNNLSGARPVEPFLQHPDLLEASCPSQHRTLLANFLSARAFKTACVLGYWGQWLQARELRRRFSRPGAWRLPYFLPSLVCSTPSGALLGSVWRKFYSARSL